uniref:Uncharacterized protein n=1 Tax=Romanomermis culicivorax TaxID=13658 RepID=A0A915HKU5_ROMCU
MFPKDEECYENVAMFGRRHLFLLNKCTVSFSLNAVKRNRGFQISKTETVDSKIQKPKQKPENLKKSCCNMKASAFQVAEMTSNGELTNQQSGQHYQDAEQ